MKCNDVLPLLRSYADRELDKPDSDLIGAHIAVCGGCAERLQAERELKLLIRAHAGSGPAPAGLMAQIKRTVRAQAGMPVPTAAATGWSRRRTSVIAASVTSALVVILAGAWFLDSLTHAARDTAPPSRLAIALVNDHIRYMSAEDKFQLETADRAEAEAWFTDRIDLPISLPRFSEPSLLLRGGRLCFVLDRQVALLFYQLGDKRFSLFVMSPEGLELAAEPRENAIAVELMLEQYMGYRSLCWHKNGLLYALVGNESYDAPVVGAS